MANCLGIFEHTRTALYLLHAQISAKHSALPSLESQIKNGNTVCAMGHTTNNKTPTKQNDQYKSHKIPSVGSSQSKYTHAKTRRKMHVKMHHPRRVALVRLSHTQTFWIQTQQRCFHPYSSLLPPLRRVKFFVFYLFVCICRLALDRYCVALACIMRQCLTTLEPKTCTHARPKRKNITHVSLRRKRFKFMIRGCVCILIIIIIRVFCVYVDRRRRWRIGHKDLWASSQRSRKQRDSDVGGLISNMQILESDTKQLY